MRNKLLLITVIVISIACNRSATDSSAKREMFDAKGQEVITSSANEKQGTMSVLYGNSAALQAALDSTGRHKPGEVFTLATWDRFANPRWYGTYINGRIKTVETIIVLPALHGGVNVEYTLVKGSGPKDVNGSTISRQDRIGFILNQEPSVFPSR
jgi:hypothetical protein